MQAAAPERHPLMRASARVYVALVLAQCGVAAFYLAQGQPLQGAVALVAVLTDFVGPGPLIAGIVLCLLAGAPLAALLAAAILGTRLVSRTGARLGSEQQRPHGSVLEALATGTTFPEAVGARLQDVAVDGSPITTRTMLAAAVAANPGRWRPLLGGDPGEAPFDGPLIVAADGVECSQFAAEAVGLARLLSERLHRPLDVELLGACAGLIPCGAASAWLDDDVSREEMFHATAGQLAAGMMAFSKTPPGADLLRRVEAASRPKWAPQ